MRGCVNIKCLDPEVTRIEEEIFITGPETGNSLTPKTSGHLRPGADYYMSNENKGVYIS